MNSFDFDYLLDETHGWARASIQVDSSRFDIDHGYCANPLSVLAGAAVILAKGGGLPRTEAIFDNEPTGHIAILRERDPTRFELWWGDDVRGAPLSRRPLLPECEIDSVAFAVAIGSALHRLFDRHGMTGFLLNWGLHSFPVREYWLLRLLLDDNPELDQLLEHPSGQAERRILALPPRWTSQRLSRRTEAFDLPYDMQR